MTMAKRGGVCRVARRRRRRETDSTSNKIGKCWQSKSWQCARSTLLLLLLLPRGEKAAPNMYIKEADSFFFFSSAILFSFPWMHCFPWHRLIAIQPSCAIVRLWSWCLSNRFSVMPMDDTENSIILTKGAAKLSRSFFRTMATTWVNLVIVRNGASSDAIYPGKCTSAGDFKLIRNGTHTIYDNLNVECRGTRVIQFIARGQNV